MRASLLLTVFLVAGAAFLLFRKSGPAASSVVAERPVSAAGSATVPGPAHSSPPPPATLTAPTRPSAVTVARLLQEIRRALLAPPESGREGLLTGLLSQLISAHPASAAQLAAGQPPGPARDELLRLLARVWAAQDFAAAIRWAASLASPEERTDAFVNACFEAARKSPVDAVDAWAAFSEAPQDPVLENLVQLWALRDDDSARAWAESQPAGERRDRALARVAFGLAHREPAAAAELVLAAIPPGPTQAEATLSVLHQWALSDFAAATAWAAQFPPGHLAERARQELAGVASYRAPGAL